MVKSSFGSVRRLPSGSYHARVRLRGRQVSVGTYPTRRQATAAIAAGVEANGDRLVDHGAARQRLGVFAEAWWATRLGHRASTRARDRLILDHDLLPFLGACPIGEVRTADVSAWVASLSTRLGPSSVRRAFTILDQLLDAAVDAAMLATNPAARVRLPRVSRPEMRFLTPDQLEALALIIDPAYQACSRARGAVHSKRRGGGPPSGARPFLLRACHRYDHMT